MRICLAKKIDVGLNTSIYLKRLKSCVNGYFMESKKVLVSCFQILKQQKYDYNNAYPKESSVQSLGHFKVKNPE